MRRAGEVASFVGGFVAAEGAFVRVGRRFALAVGLGAADVGSCHLLANWFGVGRVYGSGRRQPHYDDEVTYRVDRLADLVNIVVPFMDEHLPASYKRRQYEEWRRELLEYWEHHAKRRRPCSVDGCAEVRRARGLCRHHYYESFGK
jgi:hypothetical protein